ncbi:uncharacterized protein LOC107047043 [Diachasma alloeum]|uniref:uncharacterized protein LOC107047043 n=1 Tax=Diachasma alloeum TaxID=454923 RepID=UPI000738370A|nr:uncharacterized protein LOC107047043 [Diachasma alloeum]
MKGSIACATLVLVITAVHSIDAAELCPEENCMAPDKCEEPVKGLVECHQQGTSCCSVVRSEFRTHCRHHGGTCMDSCGPVLQRETVDCPDNQVCCVLV